MSDLTTLTSAAAGDSAQVQGMQGHHGHHHKSVADTISSMDSAIDNAVKTGKLTSDQATAMKKELADASATIKNAQGSTGQSGGLSQLSDADRKKVFGDLQDVRKQLHSALNPQGAGASSGQSGADAASGLFSQIDTDGSGSISKEEFSQFLAQIGANALGYTQNASPAGSDSTGANVSVTA